MENSEFIIDEEAAGVNHLKQYILPYDLDRRTYLYIPGDADACLSPALKKQLTERKFDFSHRELMLLGEEIVRAKNEYSQKQDKKLDVQRRRYC